VGRTIRTPVTPVLDERVTLDDYYDIPSEPPPDDLVTYQAVTLEAFIAVDEPGAAPLVGDEDAILIPEDGDVMFYGDGGAGKTTLSIDLAYHLAAGEPWLGIPITRPVQVLIVENEGPRPLFRQKLRLKHEGWEGSSIAERIRVVEAPWADLTFADEMCRAALAALICGLELDVVIVGPVTRSGMNDAGTLQHVRDFMVLVNDARRRAGRHCTFILIHHENKGGQVSGAWEGAGDTLFHVQGQGHGRTRLYVQKARWSSSHHATTMNLLWADGAGFELDENPDLDDLALADLIVAAITQTPGTAWTQVERSIKGVRSGRLRGIRDGLFADKKIVNQTKRDGAEVLVGGCESRRPSSLYLADDPTIQHLSLTTLRPEWDAGGTQAASPGGEGEMTALRPASALIGTQDGTQSPLTPPTGEDIQRIAEELESVTKSATESDIMAELRRQGYDVDAATGNGKDISF
jgi:hypothetical protein